jgi:hypothetical protein
MEDGDLDRRELAQSRAGSATTRRASTTAGSNVFM